MRKGLEMEKLSAKEADAMGFNGDIIDFYNDNPDDVEIVVATALELSSMGIGTLCGSLGNDAFSLVAQRYPNLMVRTAIYKNDECCSSDIKITSEEQGEEISELVSQMGGCLRCDYIGGEWTYFETE